MNENDTILIEKYLDKSLTAAEQQAFNARLTDPTFAQEVKLYKDALMSIYTLGDDRIKGILQEEEAKRVPPQYSEAPKPQIASQLRVRRWWAMAASFLIVASVGYWLFRPKKSNTPEALFANHFEAYKPYSYDATTRGKNEATTLNQAYTAYNNTQFSTFIAYFEQFNDLTKDELFLLANAYLGAHKGSKAIEILLKITSDNTDTHQKSAQWFLALAYLQQGNISECRTWLEKIIVQSDNVYKDKAQVLIAQLP